MAFKIPSSRRPYGAAIAANFVSATDLNTTFSSVHSHSVIWQATLPTLQAATNGTIIELMIIYAAGRMSALGLRPALPRLKLQTAAGELRGRWRRCRPVAFELLLAFYQIQ